MRLLIALHVIWFDFTIVAELQAAMVSRDAKGLRAAICKVENSHVISFASEEVEAAKRLLRHLEIIAELQTAMDSRDVKGLRAAIRKMENSHFTFSFTSEEVEAAKRLLRHLEIIEGLKEAVLKLDQKTMLELRNYSKPPKLVHRVMKAALLLLGDDETKTVVSKAVLKLSK